MKILPRNLKRKHGKGQSLGEFIILIALVALAFSVTQVYMQRKFQGRIKDLTDKIIRTDPKTEKLLDLQSYTAKDSKSDSWTKVGASSGKGESYVTVETKTGSQEGVYKTFDEVTTSHSHSESTSKHGE